LTFYSIIFAIAVTASIRQVLVAIANRDITSGFYAAVVALFVFIDTMYTSQFLEPQPGLPANEPQPV
jgi:hypothetical protein